MRKDAGFEIADRIRTWYSGDLALGEAMRAFDRYVRDETLSLELTEGAAPDGAHVESADVDGRAVTLGVVRA